MQVAVRVRRAVRTRECLTAFLPELLVDVRVGPKFLDLGLRLDRSCSLRERRVREQTVPRYLSSSATTSGASVAAARHGQPARNRPQRRTALRQQHHCCPPHLLVQLEPRFARLRQAQEPSDSDVRAPRRLQRITATADSARQVQSLQTRLPLPTGRQVERPWTLDGQCSHRTRHFDGSPCAGIPHCASIKGGSEILRVLRNEHHGCSAAF